MIHSRAKQNGLQLSGTCIPVCSYNLFFLWRSYDQLFVKQFPKIKYVNGMQTPWLTTTTS